MGQITKSGRIVVSGSTELPDAAGNFASAAPVVVPPGRMLVAFSTPGFVAVLTGTILDPLGNELDYLSAIFRNLYNTQRFTSEVFQFVTPSIPDAAVLWFLVPLVLLPSICIGLLKSTIYSNGGSTAPQET